MDGPYGRCTAAVSGFLDRVRAMEAADRDLAEEHLRNLQANAVVRKGVLARCRAALNVAVGAALRSAVPAVEEALRASEPEPRRETWRLTLVWLPVVLVTDARAASASLASPLGG